MKQPHELAHSNGMSFLLAAKTLMVPRALTETTFQLPIAPAIVCYAFSTEIFLKSLLMRDGISYKKHDLFESFELLAPETKLKIMKSAHQKLKLNNEDFITKLDKVKNAFIQWRYIHESDFGSIDLQFLTGLAEILSEVD